MGPQEESKNQPWGGDRKVLVLTRAPCSVGKGWRWGPQPWRAWRPGILLFLLFFLNKRPGFQTPRGTYSRWCALHDCLPGGSVPLIFPLLLRSIPHPSQAHPQEAGSATLSLFPPRCCLGWKHGSTALKPAASLPPAMACSC